MSRSLDQLHPDILPLATHFLATCRMAGLDPLITCTWRSPAEQADLYAIGRTKPGKRVTNALPGQSAHNFSLNGKPASLAFDIVPMRGGKPVWGTQGTDLELWQHFGRIGKACGLEWAGDWISFREFPHMQHPNADELMR